MVVAFQIACVGGKKNPSPQRHELAHEQSFAGYWLTVVMFLFIYLKSSFCRNSHLQNPSQMIKTNKESTTLLSSYSYL